MEQNKTSGGVKNLPKLWRNSAAFRTVVIAAALTAAAACVIFGLYRGCFYPYRHQTGMTRPTEQLDNVLTAGQAAEDMKYVYDRVSETHPCWIDGSEETVAAFDDAYAAQCEYLASMGDGVTVLDEWRSVAAMLAVIGDAHTYSNARPENEPVLSAVSGSDTLSGDAVLVGVGGRSTDTLYAGFKTMCSYESEVWALRCFKQAVVREPWLRAMGIDTSGDIEFEYSDDKAIKVVTYRFVPAAQAESAGEDGGQEQTAFCGYTVYEEDDLAVFRLDSCVYDDVYKQTVDSFFAEVREKGIGNIAIDLRDNTGGNSETGNYFIGYLDTESFIAFGGMDVRYGSILKRYGASRETVVPKKNTFSGGVYVLTSPSTFSSAVDFAMMISDNGLGTVVGEQPGGMPSSYGDIVIFQTPNAGVLFQVSYKYFHRIDSSKDGLPLMPDIECDADDALDTVRDISAGRIGVTE